MLAKWATELENRSLQNLYRHRHVLERDEVGATYCENQAVINFSSSNYLGLANHPLVKAACKNAIDRYGVGSGASAVVSGYSMPHRQLEYALAEFTGREKVLLFACGYMANLGVMGALFSRHACVYQDRLNHASLLDAGRMSGAKVFRYHHNNVEHLQTLLTKEPNKKKIIVTEGVFSVDGDMAPLPELAGLAKKHQAYFMVDDAHGIGVLGESGTGSIGHHQLLSDDVPLLMASFGKAFGSAGAFVAGDATTVETILQFARTYIYNTAYPPHLAAGQLAALELIKTTEVQKQLQALVIYFRQAAQSLQLPLMSSMTAIQPLLIGSAKQALIIHQKLLQKGFWVGVMRPPTVAKGSSRLRITLNAHHTVEQIDQLLEELNRLKPLMSNDDE